MTFSVIGCQKANFLLSCFAVAKHIKHHVRTLQMVVLSGPSSDVEWVPNTDVYENDTSFVVRMEVAGVTRDDIQITLSDRHLIVQGHRPDPHRTNRCRFRQMEIDYGTFERRLALPRTVDNSHAKAYYRHGFLMIELPKAGQAKHTTVRLALEQE